MEKKFESKLSKGVKMKLFRRFYDEKYYKKFCTVSDGYAEYRAKKALKYIPKNKTTILNIGCGYGFESKIFSDAGYDVVGVDVSEKALRAAKEYQIESILGDVQEGIKLPDESFNVVYSAEVLEHLAFPSYFFEEVRRLLTKDGILILMLPNTARLTNRISLLFLGQLSSDFNEEHLHEMTPRQIKKYLKDYGFEKLVFEGVMGKLTKFPTLSGEFFIVTKNTKTNEMISDENRPA
jgi:2-polyprenyl-3-methyl-5-hydroxy-6-metoxy-1,4-benzoquinol methylase